MRISDWSSDVCSSDLDHVVGGQGPRGVPLIVGRCQSNAEFAKGPVEGRAANACPLAATFETVFPPPDAGRCARRGGLFGARSAERRVGKECVRTCRSRWSPYH